MIVKIIETSLKLNPDKILIVVGKYKDIIKEEISKYLKLDNIQFIDQIAPRGTGDAIMSCRSFLQDYKNKSVLILSGDVPLVSIDTMKNTLDNLNKVKIVTSHVDNPFGLCTGTGFFIPTRCSNLLTSHRAGPKPCSAFETSSL